jgi:cystathionine beta-lyase
MTAMTAMTQSDPIEVLRERSCEKWLRFGPEILPMFVAEMDYPLAPAIREALHRAVDTGNTGYVHDGDTSAAEAFAAFAADRWGWTPSPSRMRATTDVSVVIVESLRALMRPGDGVIITPPVYPPFFDLIPEAGGAVVEVPLLDDGTSWALDLEGIDRAMAAGARGVLLCHPHNPTGTVHDRETLDELSQIVARHGGFVVSDEIHAPLVHSSAQFVPYLSVSEEARQHAIAAESGSKAFNLAGLKTALFVADSDPMAEIIKGLPAEVTGRTGLFGLIATREGFANARDWLDDTVRAIESNFDLLESQLAEKLPAARLRRGQATYLAWVDMSHLPWGSDPAKGALAFAGVALVSGLLFGKEGAGHARMNLACSPEMVIEAVDRMANACAPEALAAQAATAIGAA